MPHHGVFLHPSNPVAEDLDVFNTRDKYLKEL